MSNTQTKQKKGQAARNIEDAVYDLMGNQEIEPVPIEELSHLGMEITPSVALNLTLLKGTLKNEMTIKYLSKMKTLDDFRPLALLDLLYSNYDTKEQKAVFANVDLLLQKGEQSIKDVLDYALSELNKDVSKKERTAPMEKLNEIVDNLIKNYKTAEELEIKSRLLERNPAIKERLEQKISEDEAKRKDLEERLGKNYVYNFARIVGRDLKNNAKAIAKGTVYYPSLILGGLLPGKVSEAIYNKLHMDSGTRESSQNWGYFIEGLSIAGISLYSIPKVGNYSSDAWFIGIMTALVGGIFIPLIRGGMVNNGNTDYHGSMFTTIPYYIGKGLYEVGKTAVYRIPKGIVGYFKDTAKKAMEETIKEEIGNVTIKEHVSDHKKNKMK